jgi:hypothetical protein
MVKACSEWKGENSGLYFYKKEDDLNVFYEKGYVSVGLTGTLNIKKPDNYLSMITDFVSPYYKEEWCLNRRNGFRQLFLGFVLRGLGIGFMSPE